MSKKKAVWTVMVYLAGDNNLTTECLFALTEMKKARPGTQINVIAQFDPRDERVPSQRFEINRNGPKSSIFEDIIDEARFDRATQEVRFTRESSNAEAFARSRQVRQRAVEDLVANTDDLSPLTFRDEIISNETDTGSPVTFYNFLSFCIQEYPAEHYMVVLSGHSGGTSADYLLSDESPRGSLTFNELKAVFKQLRNDLGSQTIDIIGMDNCLMSMAEICYELRGHAQFLVGSETYSPASGWPYREILERLNASRDAPAREIASSIVEEYTNYYSGYWLAGLSIAQSALDLTKVEDLRTLVNKLGSALEIELIAGYEPDPEKRLTRRVAQPFRDALVLAHWETQSYNGEQFVDLYDFCNCLEARVSEREVLDSCANLKQFLETQFVIKSRFVGAKYQYSYGLSIYFPWSGVASSYWNVDFVSQSAGAGWGSFLDTYIMITRREPRNPDIASELIEATSQLEDNLPRTNEDRMAVDRMAIDRMAIDRMAIDRMAIDRMVAGGGSNPVYSMRNPPFLFFPTVDMNNRSQTIAAQERFWAKPKVKTET
jgi:hypothetical protein